MSHTWLSHVKQSDQSAWATCHMHESRPIYTSHIPCEWVTSHMNESRLINMPHDLYNESRPMCISHVPCTRVTSHINHTHQIFLDELKKSATCGMRLVPYAWITSHIHVSRPIYPRHDPFTCLISHTREPRPIYTSHVPYTRVTFHIQESRPTHMSHVPCECGMSWVWVSHTTHRRVISYTGESCQTGIRPATHTSSLAAVLTTCCTLANHFARVNESSRALPSHFERQVILNVSESCHTHLIFGCGIR